MRAIDRATWVICVGLLLGAGLSGCTDEAAAPQAGGDAGGDDPGGGLSCACGNDVCQPACGESDVVDVMFCAADCQPGSGAGGAAGTSGGAGGGTLTGGGGDAGSSSGGEGGGGTGQGGQGGAGGSGGACAGELHLAERVPLDLYVMLDQSASMDDLGKWSSATSALQTFVSSSDSAGVGIGLQYFPLPPAGAIPDACQQEADCGLYGPCLPSLSTCAGSLAADTSCDGADYSTADVPIGVLPGAATAILGSIDAHAPTGSATPIQPAMVGAVAYATTWEQANPTHQTYVVFATDGEPTGCSEGVNDIGGAALAAAAAAAATPPVKTFVIGIGAGLGGLDQIAIAGGTNQAFAVDTGQNLAQQFLDALNTIATTNACTFQIPVPGQGAPDYQMVNVVVTDPAAPGESKPLFYRAQASACDGATGGWYYDDPSDPTTIELCETSCDSVQVTGGSVKVVLGCEALVE